MRLLTAATAGATLALIFVGSLVTAPASGLAVPIGLSYGTLSGSCTNTPTGW